MFPRLFKPKWEHPDPAVRVAALTEADIQPAVLERLAADDADPTVRQAAILRVGDLALLSRLAEADRAEAVRAAAQARVIELVCAPETAVPPIGERLSLLRGPMDSGIAARVVQDARSAEVRLGVLDRVADPEVLAAVACQDPVASVRRAAFDLIVDPAGWERVARECRDRDRQLSRVAREKVEAHERAAAELAKAEGLCAELEALLPGGPDLAAGSRRLLREWQGLAGPLPPAVVERFEGTQAAIAETLARREALEGERRGLCEEVESLLATAGGAETPVEARALAARIRVALRAAGLRWGELEAHERGDPALERRFDAAMRSTEGRAAGAERDARRAEALAGLLRAGREVLAAEGPLDAKRVAALQRRWDREPGPEGESLAGGAQAAFAELRRELEARLERESAQRLKALEQAEQELPALQEKLAEGALHDALAQVDRIRHRLRLAGDVDARRAARLERRLHDLQPRIEELRRWRHWGSARAREELCQEMEGLAVSALAPADLAVKARAARDAWRRIDHDEGPAPQTLWRRFDAACTQCYEPYRRHLEQQAAARDRHLETRRSLVQEIEALDQGTDWEHPDWAEVDRGLRDLRRRWDRASPVPRQAGKVVERAFREVYARVDAHLEAERAREVQRRRALIERLRQLASAPDARGSMREAREAQQAWRPTVPADQREEQALWEEFRAAREAVFARSAADREQADASRRKNLARREEVCAGLEALLAGEALDSAESGRRLQELEREWRDAGAVPRELERALEDRYRDLRARVSEARRDRGRARALGQLDGLGRRAELCTEVEQQALAGTSGESDAQALVARVREAWSALSPLPAEVEAPVARRLERASAALVGPQGLEALRAELPANLSRRLTLCLEMEVLAGIDSPPEAREERMRLQVSRLAQALRDRRGEETSALERVQNLEGAWYALGPVAGDRWEALRGRFEAARAAARLQVRAA